jgi:hypothetical protein
MARLSRLIAVISVVALAVGCRPQSVPQGTSVLQRTSVPQGTTPPQGLAAGSQPDQLNTAEAQPAPSPAATERSAQMTSPIAGLDYAQLFAMGEGARLLAKPDMIPRLEAFVRDPAGNPYERVLVAELLHKQQGRYLLDKSAMANLHAQAIAQAPMHNPWGLPGEPIDFGQALLDLGTPIEEALQPLLKNTTPLRYVGSEEPTIARLYKYRVADLAAGILAARRGIPFVDNQDPAVRDAWIREHL